MWGNTFISNLSSLNIIHKKVVRLISNCKYNSSSIIIRKLRVLKLLDIVNFKTAEIVLSDVRNKLPKNIPKHFCVRDKAYGTQTKNSIKDNVRLCKRN